jgi:hypothetical protein
MNPELAAKLLADLAKTGFDSEMRAVQACRSAGWSATGSESYYDRDAEISREIDLNAYRVLNHNDGNGKLAVDCTFQISAEVKKSKAPWVVFRAPEGHMPLVDAWQNLISNCGLPEDRPGFYRTLHQHSLVAELGWRGHGIHEAFKDPDAPSRWYKAFLSACKAAEAALDANKEEGTPYAHFSLSKPVLILDGPLVLAELAETGEIALSEINAAPFDFGFATPKYTRDSYAVDLVTLGWMPQYLKLSERRHQSIFDALVAEFERGQSAN